MNPKSWIFIVLLLVFTYPVAAQNEAIQLASRTEVKDLSIAEDKPFVPLVTPSLTVSPSVGEIEIDGNLDEEAWKHAARATGFAEVQPGNQIKAQVDTEALVTYDERHLYVAFRAFDDPRTIRTSFRNRDDVFEDDWVGVFFDTFGDATQAYEIFVNPLGIQMDLFYSGNREDPGFDMVFDSEGRLTEDGYQVEMAIPFSSLRFPNQEVQNWRMTFIRNHPRETRRIYSWATISNENACLLCQFGTISGIEGAKPGTRLRMIPAAVGMHSGALSNDEDPASTFTNNRFRPELSLNVRYDFTSNLAAEATVNPDFSQIGSDAQQIDVNSTFALFYPERRPFFQEGSDLFNTLINVVYTRSINNPIAATKLTGRLGRTSVAYLSAMDEDTPLLLPFEERSELIKGGRSISNILRARHSFGTNSSIGAILTDRRLYDGGSGTTASTDLRMQFLKRYSFQAQLAVSNTYEPDNPALSSEIEDDTFDNGRYTASFDGENFAGYGLYLGVDRSSRYWNFDISYLGYSPTFRTANGFVTRNDYQTLRMFQTVRFYPKWGFINIIGPMIHGSRQFDFSGTRIADRIQPSLYMQLKGQTHVEMYYGFSRERFHDIDFDGIREWVLHVSSNFSDPLSGGFYVVGGRQIARNIDTPELGRQFSAGVFATIKPLQRFCIRPSFIYDSLWDLETDESLFNGYILRSEMSFQLMRELSFRLNLQYNDFDDRFALEPLVTYQINPFTAFYVGSTHNYAQFGRPYGFAQMERQIFFKFQYLIQR